MNDCVNTLTADDEYSRDNRENLLLPIQIQLSTKIKNILLQFIEFFESISNFEHFEHEPHSLSISEIIDSVICGYLNV